MKSGLVLEGGGMRGLFTAGVLDVFMENGIGFDGCVGVSAGALFGCNIKSRQPGRAVRYNVKYCRDKRYVSIFNLLFTGNIFGVDFCYRRIPFELDPWDHETFEKDPMEFYAVCTDAVTGEPYYHRCTDGTEKDIEYFRASASLPMVSKVVDIGDRHFVDGGVSDAIPLRFFQEKGYGKIVVIATRPEDYEKQSTRAMPLLKLMYKKRYPGIVSAMERRHIMYNDTTAYIKAQEQAGNIYVIRPFRDLHISQTCNNPDELKRVYRIGRHIAKKNIESIREFILGNDAAE